MEVEPEELFDPSRPNLPVPVKLSVHLPKELVAELRRLAVGLNAVLCDGRRVFGESKVLGVLAESLWRIAGYGGGPGLPRELLEVVVAEHRRIRRGRPPVGARWVPRGGVPRMLWAKVVTDWRGLVEQHVVPGLQAMGFAVRPVGSVTVGRVMLAAVRWRPNPGTWGLTEPDMLAWLERYRHAALVAREQLRPTAHRQWPRQPRGWPYQLEETPKPPKYTSVRQWFDENPDPPDPRYVPGPLHPDPRPLQSGTDECEAGSEV